MNLKQINVYLVQWGMLQQNALHPSLFPPTSVLMPAVCSVLYIYPHLVSPFCLSPLLSFTLFPLLLLFFFFFIIIIIITKEVAVVWYMKCVRTTVFVIPQLIIVVLLPPHISWCLGFGFWHVSCIVLPVIIIHDNWHPVWHKSCNIAVKNKFSYAYTQEFPYRTNHILECEFYLLENLDCCLIVYQPYRPLLQLIQDIGQEDQLLALAWRVVNDSLRTDVCLLYPPYQIALGE